VSQPFRIVAAASLVMVLVGCSGAPAASTGASTAGASATLGTSTPATASPIASIAPSPTVAATASVTPAPTAPPSTGAFTLGASVWWSGFEIATSDGTYDAVKHALTINAAFTNTGTQGSELRNLSDGTKVSWNGQDLPAFVSFGVVGPGATAAGQISVAVPVGFSVANAVLTFGATDQHRALVPLDGTAATSDRPTGFTLPGKVTMGKYVTYTVTSALLVPGSCSGYPDRIRYGPLQADLLSIVVFGTAASKDPISDRQIDRATLVLADGSKVASVPVMGIELPANTSKKNQAMCFAVDAPGNGSFKLQMHEYRANATGTLAFLLQ